MLSVPGRIRPARHTGGAAPEAAGNGQSSKTGNGQNSGTGNGQSSTTGNGQSSERCTWFVCTTDGPPLALYARQPVLGVQICRYQITYITPSLSAFFTK